MRLRFKIFNKNLTVIGDYSSAKSYPIDDNCLINENKNETLDSMNIRISHIEEIEIEPYDYCIVYDEDNVLEDRYMAVDSYVMTQSGIGADNQSFNYEISLFSQTKDLEGEILPNLSITNIYPQYARSLFWQMRKFLYLYGQKRRFYNGAREIRPKYDFESFEFSEEQGQVQLSPHILLALSEETVFELLEIDVPQSIYNNYYIYDVIQTSEQNRAGYFYEYIGYDDKTHKIGIIRKSVYNTAILPFTVTFKYVLIPKTVSNDIGRFCAKKCPEMQWNAPTLREVLNDLMMVDDCIPILRNGIIKPFDLTTKGNEITDFNYLQKSQSSEDYASEIRMELQNSTQEGNANIDVLTRTCKSEMFTCDGAILTSNNFKLTTQNRILKVKHLWVWCFNKVNTGTEASPVYENMLRKIDLCNVQGYSFVKEKQEYDTLETSGATLATLLNSSVAYRSKHKEFCVYYERGGTTIDGWHDTIDYIILPDYTTLELIMISALGQSSTRMRNTSNKHLSLTFQIEYETFGDCAFSVSKTIYPTNRKVIADNQQNSWVNARLQGDLEKQKVNRIGNQIIMFNQRCDGNNPIRIGDTYGDGYIVYKTQYQVYRDHLECNAYAVKDYILKNYFVGINSQVKTWSNANKETLVRQDLNKFYCEFSAFRKQEWFDVDNDGYSCNLVLSNNGILSFFVPVTSHGERKMIKYAIWKLDNSNGLIVDLTKRITGDSITLSVGFQNNMLADSYIKVLKSDDEETDDAYYTNLTDDDAYPSIVSNVAGRKETIVKYSKDVTATLDNFTLWFTNEVYTQTDNPYVNVPIEQPLDKDDIKQFLRNSALNGYYSLDKAGVSPIQVAKKINKDNRDILRESVEFEFCTDTRDIYVGKAFIEHQEMIAIADNSYKIYTGDLDDFDFANPSIENATSRDGTTSLENPVGLTVKFKMPNYGNVAYYITDENDNIMLATKGLNEIYLNILRDRDCNIYDDSGIIISKLS